jgi:hypothetical protein
VERDLVLGLIILLVIIPLVFAAVVLALLAALGRHRVRRWRRRATVESNDDLVLRGPVSFPTIWFQTTPPRRRLRAYDDRVTGELLVGPDEGQVLFKPNPGGTLVLSKIVDVQMGRRGTDLANAWIEVHAEMDAAPTVVYLNDGTWMGWRPLLSDSNVRIATALAQLLPARTASRR